MPVDTTDLDKAIAAIRKKYGEANVHKGSDQPAVDRISTGSIELDFATGGGIPIGRFSRFYGGFSSGKTLTSMNVIRNAQALGAKCAYYNIEKQFIKDHWHEQGINIDDLLVIEGTTIEETGAKLEALMSSCHVHVLDSLSSAISIDELGANVEDWQMGLAARAWGKVLRRTLERFDSNENVVLLIDQVRDVFGSSGEEPPGGRFIEHTSSMSLYFRRSSWLFKKDDGSLDPDAPPRPSLSDSMEPDGMEFLIRVNKSRVGRPLRTARVRMDFEDAKFDTVNELIKAGKYFGVIDVNGSWLSLPDGRKAQGAAKFREIIEDDEKLQEEIRDKVKEMW